MNKPVCTLCSKQIQSNEHFFITRRYTLCRGCGIKFRGTTRDEVHNPDTDDNTCCQGNNDAD